MPCYQYGASPSTRPEPRNFGSGRERGRTARYFSIELIPLLGSVIHQRRLQVAMERFQSRPFIAAAYKHVPIVERNPIEGCGTTCSVLGAPPRPPSPPGSEPSC